MTTASTNFQDLLKAIEQTEADTDALTKSDVADDQDDHVIGAAAESSDDDGDGKDKEVGKEPVMSKSMTVKDADGKDVEAIDATEIIKALQDKVGSQETVMAKALTSLQSTLAKQNTMIKSLQDSLAKLAGEGRGRKAVLMAVEKPGAGDTVAKSAGADKDGATTMEDFMLKAEQAFSAKKITGQEFNTIDVCRRMGAQIDPALIRKVALA